MKAISLTEPWATLVAIGAKQIETRSWGTDYRGPLAIHASKKLTGDDLAMAQEPVFNLALREGGIDLPHWRDIPVKDAFRETRGCVIATARLIACCRMEWCPDNATICVLDHRRSWEDAYRPIPARELPFGWYDVGRWAWILVDVRRLPEPLPARGALGLWDWPVVAP